MKKVLLLSVLGLSAVASVAYAATGVPAIPGVTAPATSAVTKVNQEGNHNNRFGYGVSPDNTKYGYSFSGAATYPVAPAAGTADGKPLNDGTRKFGHNSRFGAAFEARYTTSSATPAAPSTPATPSTPAAPSTPATPATPAAPSTPAASAALPAITVKKPVGAPAAADLPSQANVTGTTNARFGAAAQEDRDNNNVAYDAVYQAGTYPVAPAAGTKDGKPLNDAGREFGHNTRFGAAGQGSDIKAATTFENTNYSAVVNGN
ncbi:hypothetical protein MK546_08955 [Streptococcus cristatus]|uniref:Uncharacterized protein n=1 Tax=Streptococcus cristatus TaxID=45634 RepID=A0AAW5WQ54_STRCR|nr:hypothetical protein [Streptococcus cristatus]MCY7222205.1 hypothetical protein [Streptococcus cristatus]